MDIGLTGPSMVALSLRLDLYGLARRAFPAPPLLSSRLEMFRAACLGAEATSTRCMRADEKMALLAFN